MVPHFDLKRQTQQLKPELMQALESAVDRCQFILGDDVSALEESFARFSQAKAAAGVSSGTSALHLALLACGIQPGDEVITTPFTFAATVASIMYVNAKPVFVDIDPETFTLDPRLIDSAISKKTKAIMPVHLYGQTADIDPILEIARTHSLKVIEDSAQAHGAEYKNRRAGSLGDIAGFSFYPGKNIGACGEGGIVTSNDESLIELVKTMRNWGQKERYNQVTTGFNYRMDGFQGAVLKVKMNYLEGWTERRIAIAERYLSEIQNDRLTLPKRADYCNRHVFHQFVLRVKERDAFREFMTQKEIGTNIHYPQAVYAMPAYKELGYPAGTCPEAEKAAQEVVSIPLFPEMTDNEVSTVIEAINAWQ